MGHIDHGKSTLLDFIRNTNIVDGEAGGITQHISAYEVEHTNTEGNTRTLTFLDTPGHVAFQKMRLSGAEIADIAILIVSAEEGVKAQTLEALACITQAALPYVVAINKIDKPNANIEKIKQELLEHEVFLEGLGGDVPYAPISAKHGDGVDNLLDLVLLVADMAELRGDLSKPAEGIVVEAHLDPKKGTSATLIIKDGTLRLGMYVASGSAVSPVRIFEDCKGNAIQEARFSSPVCVVGWNKLPETGAPFTAHESKKDAEKTLLEEQAAPPQAIEAISDEHDKQLFVPLIIKADVRGTLDAIEHEIAKLTIENTRVRIVHSGVGAISESDVKLARSSEQSIIIGFNTTIDAPARELADRNAISIQTFDIIYKLSEWLSDELQKRRPKKEVEEISGAVRVVTIFSKTKHKHVLGGKLEHGTLSTGNGVRIMRKGVSIGRGKVVNLQQNRADVKRVETGEFGAQVESVLDIVPGDMLETIVITKK